MTNEKNKYEFEKDLSVGAIITRILHGEALPHSVLHEGECIVRLVPQSHTCCVCGIRARISVDGYDYCLPCADDFCCQEQKKEIKKGLTTP